MEDSRILELYWQRDEQAIRETKDAYGGYCFSVANAVLENAWDAEEVVAVPGCGAGAHFSGTHRTPMGMLPAQHHERRICPPLAWRHRMRRLSGTGVPIRMEVPPEKSLGFPGLFAAICESVGKKPAGCRLYI